MGIIRSIGLLVVGGTSLILVACASIVSETESTTYIETDSETARCELHGQDFKRVLTTPTSIHLPAAAAPITIACKATGYKTTTEVLDTDIDGWIFGNIIFGGLVGIVVDAARGAGQKYPPRITVLLQPETFPSAASRDEWFDNRQQTVNSRWEKVIKAVENQCASESAPENCKDLVSDAQQKRDKELAKLAAEKPRANILKAAFTPGTDSTTPAIEKIETSSPAKATVEARLEELKRLLEKGLMTPDEAAAKRKQILEGL